MISGRMNHHDSSIPSFMHDFQLLSTERMERIENHDLRTYGIMTMLATAGPATVRPIGYSWGSPRGGGRTTRPTSPTDHGKRYGAIPCTATLAC